MPPYVFNLQLCHSLPGRSRFRISTIRHNSEAANRLEAWMGRCGAVHSAYANPVTGTLLVYYNSQALALPELEHQLRMVLADGLPSAPVVRPVAESSVSSAVWRFLGLTGVMGVVLVTGPNLRAAPHQLVFLLPVPVAFPPAFDQA